MCAAYAATHVPLPALPGRLRNDVKRSGSTPAKAYGVAGSFDRFATRFALSWSDIMDPPRVAWG